MWDIQSYVLCISHIVNKVTFFSQKRIAESSPKLVITSSDNGSTMTLPGTVLGSDLKGANINQEIGFS